MVTYMIYKTYKENKKRNQPNSRLLNIVVFAAGIYADTAIALILCDVFGIWNWIK